MTGALRQPIDPKSESFKRRAELLLPELRNFGKVNSLVDKRLGEKDKSLSKEDKIARRFALERTRRLKKNLFKLGDTGEEETLTHFGQRLSDDIIERMDKPLKEEEEDDGVLGADFVQMAHFGGGEDEDPNGEQFQDRFQPRLLCWHVFCFRNLR